MRREKRGERGEGGRERKRGGRGEKGEEEGRQGGDILTNCTE
jgi:hypothetical protein